MITSLLIDHHEKYVKNYNANIENPLAHIKLTDFINMKEENGYSALNIAAF